MRVVGEVLDLGEHSLDLSLSSNHLLIRFLGQAVREELSILTETSQAWLRGSLSHQIAISSNTNITTF